MNRIFNRLKVFLFLFTSFALTQSVNATDYYVAANGNDANPGTMASPWKTLNKAITVAHGGDVIYVRGGEYQEGEIWMNSNRGTGPGKLLTIKAYVKETPIFSNGSRGLIIDISYVRIEGLHFTNGKNIYSLSKIGHNQYVNNKFYGTGYGYSAISMSGDSMLVEKNVIDIVGGAFGTQSHGIYVSSGKGKIVRNNRISGITGYGVHIFDQRRSGDPAGYERLVSDVIVDSNVVYNSQERAGIIVAAYDHATVKNVVIRNNVLYGHAGSGIVIRDDVSDIKVYNNTIYDINTDGSEATGDDAIYVGARAANIVIRNNVFSLKNAGNHITVSGATNVTADHNLYWPSPLRLFGITESRALMADPKFMDANNKDFHLKPGSPAIDAGVNVGLSYTGAAPDLGAFEFGSITNVEEWHRQPGQYYLQPNYPNPFNPQTKIEFQLPQNTHVTLTIFNTLGQAVRTLVDKLETAGFKAIVWDGQDDKGEKVKSGIYYYHLNAGPFRQARKMVLLE